MALEYARARIQMRGPHRAGCYRRKIIANEIGANEIGASPRAVRLGHASLMRPDRPLSTRRSPSCRYAAIRTLPWRSLRPK